MTPRDSIAAADGHEFKTGLLALLYPLWTVSSGMQSKGSNEKKE